MNMFENEEYQANKRAYIAMPDNGHLASLRESFKKTVGFSLRTIVPVNSKYPLSKRPELMSYLSRYKTKYPRIDDIVVCILDGYISKVKRFPLPYKGSDRKKIRKRLCNDCRKEELELKSLTKNSFADIRLARFIITIYLYDVYLTALPYHICDKLYDELVNMNSKIAEYYYKAPDDVTWKLKRRSKTVNIAKRFGLDVAERIFIYRRTHQ